MVAFSMVILIFKIKFGALRLSLVLNSLFGNLLKISFLPRRTLLEFFSMRKNSVTYATNMNQLSIYIIMDCPFCRIIWFRVGIRVTDGTFKFVRDWIYRLIKNNDLSDENKIITAITTRFFPKKISIMVFDMKLVQPDNIVGK